MVRHMYADVVRQELHPAHMRPMFSSVQNSSHCTAHDAVLEAHRD